jgi:spermidine/putrescine transport system permease protein
MTLGARPRRIDSLLVYGAAYLAFLYIPLLFIVLFSFNDSIYVAFPLQGFTWQWYEAMWRQEALVASLINSLKLATVVAVVSTIFGTLAAKALTRYRLKGSSVVVTFIMIPFVIPGIILGISLLVLTNHLGMELSLVTIGLGHVLIAVPFSMLVMISRMEGFDKSLEEASLDLGESAWSTYWRITFPLSLPGTIASLLLTFTLSFDEFIIAFFLSGKEATLPLFVWSQLRFPQNLPNVLALGSCILLVSTLVITAAEWFRRRNLKVEQRAEIGI